MSDIEVIQAIRKRSWNWSDEDALHRIGGGSGATWIYRLIYDRLLNTGNHG